MGVNPRAFMSWYIIIIGIIRIIRGRNFLVMTFSSLFMLCLVLTARNCFWEEVELLCLEVCATLTLCLRMEVKFFSWSQKVFVNLSIIEDMAACCSIIVFKFTFTELSTDAILEFWMVFWTRWFELIGANSGKLLVSSFSRDVLLTP